MRTLTPRGVPVFVPPRPAISTLGPAPKPLLGPIVVVCGAREHELRSGSLLLGRSSECEIVLDDPLVSRVHARIQVDPDGVKVEDLYSTNGVYLNGDRILHAQLLHQGSQVFIGSQEIGFRELHTDPVPAAPSSRAPAPSTPRSSVFPEAEFNEPKTYPTSTSGAPEIPITARAEALDVLGSLARHLTNDVKAEQAPRILGPHLKGILRGASAGLVVPETLCELASEYAIDLAHWTEDPQWLNYVVELHTVTRRLMSAATISALQRSTRWVGGLDRRMLEYYVGSFTPRDGRLGPEEKSRLATLRRILKKK